MESPIRLRQVPPISDPPQCDSGTPQSKPEPCGCDEAFCSIYRYRCRQCDISDLSVDRELERQKRTRPCGVEANHAVTIKRQWMLQQAERLDISGRLQRGFIEQPDTPRDHVTVGQIPDTQYAIDPFPDEIDQAIALI